MELIEVVSERMKALLEAYDYSQYMLFLKSGVPRSTSHFIIALFHIVSSFSQYSRIRAKRQENYRAGMD